MARYRHVFFDFDGVLCDSLDRAMRVFNDLRESDFQTLPAVADRRDMVTVYGGSLRTCLDAWLTPEEHRRFFDLHSRAMAASASDLRAFPGAIEMLRGLPSGSASIVTSAYSDAVVRILAAGDGGSRPASLDTIAGREWGQTKTAKIGTLLDRLSLDAGESIYVGDLESDILYCRDVPIDIVAVGYGYHPATHLSECEPTYMVESVDELSALLRELML